MTEGRLVGGWLLLTVTEDLVGAGVGRLRQRLLDSSAGHRYLVLDLTAVDRIDSTGLGVMVGALKRLRAGNGQLRLAAARGDVARVLHATGLDTVLPLYPDVASALELQHRTGRRRSTELHDTRGQAPDRLGQLEDPPAHQQPQGGCGQPQHTLRRNRPGRRPTHQTSTTTRTARPLRAQHGRPAAGSASQGCPPDCAGPLLPGQGRPGSFLRRCAGSIVGLFPGPASRCDPCGRLYGGG